MAEMAAATPAEHFGSVHEQAAVGPRDHRVRKWPIEARPARAAVELGRRAEEWKDAPLAGEGAAAMLLVERTCEGPFGACFAEDMVALRAKQLLPFSG